MSPAGHWPQLHAAIEAGADAVYFGLNHFSARAKVGFTLQDLPKAMKTLHRRGVKGFVTFNTLVFDHEIRLAENTIGEISNAGVDAIIVQDIGIAQLSKRIAPDLEIHGSTQMSITSAEGAELAKSFGCNRIVLGRELSLTDMRKIADQTDVELEVFVHGALCVSYSGQCFSSEAWGGRSANRGKCAQACRLSYDLMVDGEQRDLGEYRYLLSPGDLYALEQIPELVDIGIACFKIEGRYKSPEYVALTTAAYRKAIDNACFEVPNEIDEQEFNDLQQVYSRGLGAHFVSGVNHQTVVTGRAPRHRGLKMGTVQNVGDDFIDVKCEFEIKPGDGVVLDAATRRNPSEKEEGGNVYEVEEMSGADLRLKFGRKEVDFSRIEEGDILWRTNDPQLSRRLRPITAANDPVYTRPIFFVVKAQLNQPIEIVASLESGETVTFTGKAPLPRAQKRALDEATLFEKLGRLGGSPFHLGGINFDCKEPVFMPTSAMNHARRELVKQLVKLRMQKPERKIVDPVDQEQEKAEAPALSENHIPDVKLHLLVRTPEQLDAAIDCAPATITLDYLELYGLRPSVEKIKAANILARVASPRILKPAEQKVVRFLLSLECPIVVRSGGLLHDLITNYADNLPPLIGDFSLNAANALAFKSYLELGLSHVTPTYDLNSKQIKALPKKVDPRKLEVIAYSHLPVFHTEHCVFCRFLSEGTDSTNCGHPCEKHQLAVRDEQGREHPVMADVGCRNTVFGAEAQTDAYALEQWTTVGIENFRIEFVHQSAQQVMAISSAFQKYFGNSCSAKELAAELEHHSPQKTATGSLFVPKDFGKLVQLS